MADLKKAVLISVGEKYIVFVLQFVSSVVLARILSPHEIGIFSIGSLVLSLSHALRDLGISNYIIQEKELTPQRLQTAATITLAMSWLLAVVALLVSGPVAAFYREEGVGQVLVVLSLNFFILPFGSVSAALLRRKMQFGRLIRINLASAFTHAAVGIGLCYHGVGFIGLAWAGVAGTVVSVVLTLLISEREVTARPALGEWRHVLQTGGRFAGASLLWEFGLSAPEMIVGKTMSVESAGYLGRAQGVVGLAYRSLMEGLMPVLMPFFAQSHRGGEDVLQHFLKSVRYLSALSFPIFACMAVAMDAIVLLLYGEQWNGAVEPARILCAGMAALSIGVTAGAAVGGMGHSEYALRFQIVGQPVKFALILAGSLVALPQVALGVAAGDMFITAYTLLVLGRILRFSAMQFVAALLPSIFVTACASLACAAFRLAVPDAGPFNAVIGCVTSSALGWAGGLWLTRHPIGDEVAAVVRRVARR